jgi:multidrug efflux system outer membrane protein
MASPFKLLSLKTTLAAPIATLFVLGGCATLEPAYRRPASPTPAAFPQAVAAASPSAAGQTAPGQTAAAISYQRFFIDPNLRSVIALALANNRDLRVAVANIEASRAQYRVQRANLLPTINASANAVYGRAQTETATGAVEPYNEHQYTVGLGASSYEVDLFGRVRSLTKAALETYLATEEARRASQISIISEAATDYLTLAADEAILKTAKDTQTSGAASLEVTQKRFENGVASQLDVRQAQTIVEEARADVAADATLVAQDKNALDLVVGAVVPEALLPRPMDDQVMVMTDLPAGLPSEVLLSRPDVLEAEHQLKSENAQIGAARAAFFPAITLTGSGGASSASLSTLFKGASGIWSFEPQITLPIFAGGANRANLDYAKAERKVYLAQYEKAIQSAFRDVADALARRATIGEQIDADEADVAAAADSLKLSQARYDRGSDTYLNVLTAQRTLFAAQQALDSARLVRSTNLVTLYQALGGGVN